MSIPYGAATVAKVSTSGSGSTSVTTIYTASDNDYFLAYVHTTGDVVLAWTDWESNSLSTANSGAEIKALVIRAKNGTNVTYQITSAGSWAVDLVLVKL